MFGLAGQRDGQTKRVAANGPEALIAMARHRRRLLGWLFRERLRSCAARVAVQRNESTLAPVGWWTRGRGVTGRALMSVGPGPARVEPPFRIRRSRVAASRFRSTRAANQRHAATALDALLQPASSIWTPLSTVQLPTPNRPRLLPSVRRTPMAAVCFCPPVRFGHPCGLQPPGSLSLVGPGRRLSTPPPLRVQTCRHAGAAAA